jgi:hypothetical protein
MGISSQTMFNNWLYYTWASTHSTAMEFILHRILTQSPPHRLTPQTGSTVKTTTTSTQTATTAITTMLIATIAMAITTTAITTTTTAITTIVTEALIEALTEVSTMTTTAGAPLTLTT